MHPEFLVSVDIGTAKVAVLVGEYSREGTMRITGATSEPSSGITKGMVVDIEQAAGCLQRAVNRAEKMAGVEIEGVCASLSGHHIRSINSRGEISITKEGHEITAADVVKVTEKAGNITLPADMEIIHMLAKDFTVDSRPGVRDPVGMVASRLGAEVHVVTAQTVHVENLMKIFEKNGLDVMNLIFLPLASSESLLTREEMESGCLLIDIGSGITDYVFYYGGSIRMSGVIPVGGDNITKDLGIGLRISEAVAEEVKIKYGLALESLAGKDEVIIMPGEQENGGREIRKQIIAAIIEPRCEEIFSMIKATVSSDRFYPMMGGGIVITGGGSMVMGMKSVAGQVFDMPVRRGIPSDIDGLSEIVSEESWSAGVGLLLYESRRILGEEEEKRTFGRFMWMMKSIRKIASLF